MFPCWEYDSSSLPALEDFRKAVRDKQNMYASGKLAKKSNRWSHFADNTTLAVRDNTMIEIAEEDEPSNVDATISKIEIDVPITKCADVEIEKTAQKFIKLNFEHSYLKEDILLNTNAEMILEYLSNTASDSAVLNVSRAFLRIEENGIENVSKIFFKSFLFPCISSREHSKILETCVFEFLQTSEFAEFCSFVLVPIMLRDRPSALVSIAFVSKLTSAQQLHILKEYLEKVTAEHTWVFPVVLRLYNSSDSETSYELTELIMKFLRMGHRSRTNDIGFAKILRSVIINLGKKESHDYLDLRSWNDLKAIAECNETAFKKSCLNILNKI